MMCPPRTEQYQSLISFKRFVWNTTCASLVGGMARTSRGILRPGGALRVQGGEWSGRAPLTTLEPRTAIPPTMAEYGGSPECQLGPR